MTESPNSGICLICKQPLHDEDGRKFWHESCEVCQICGAEMHHANKVIEKCLVDGGPVAHLGCHHKTKIQELKDKHIPITKDHIRVLNESILMMRYIVEPDETDYTTLFNLRKDVVELAAAISFVLDLTKDKIRIADREEYAEKIKAEKKTKAESAERNAETEQAKVERAALLARERENPFLRDKRKAIEGLIRDFKLPVEVCTAMVEDGMRKAGKDPTTGQPIQ